MRRNRRWLAMACALLVSAAAPAYSAEPANRATAGREQTEAAATQKVLAATTFRASKLIGMNVRNKQGEALGQIDDLVVDVRNGKVSYAAMSVGGVLGFGDKLLAVPFDKLAFDHGQDEMFFVLDMPAEKIAAAPGFNKGDWPDFADPNWSAKIDKQYRQFEKRTGAEDHSAPRKRTNEIGPLAGSFVAG